MKSLIFDTSSIISLASTNLLWILKPLKKQFKGDFLISNSVKGEVIDKPLNSKKFGLEALMIRDRLMEGQLKLYKSDKEIETKTKQLLKLANNIYSTKNNSIKIIQKAEMESLAIAIKMGSKALVMDERTLRLLLEGPENLSKLLSRRMNNPISMNKQALNSFKNEIKNIKVIRSTELALIAYDLGVLDKYITSKIKEINLKGKLLENSLWALKLNGCAISSFEINEMLKFKGF